MARNPQIVALLLLAGCASAPDMPKEVRIPIPTKCIDSLPLKPAIKEEAEIKAMPDYQATLTVWTERIKLRDYSAELEAVAGPCVK